MNAENRARRGNAPEGVMPPAPRPRSTLRPELAAGTGSRQHGHGTAHWSPRHSRRWPAARFAQTPRLTVNSPLPPDRPHRCRLHPRLSPSLWTSASPCPSHPSLSPSPSSALSSPVGRQPIPPGVRAKGEFRRALLAGADLPVGLRVVPVQHAAVRIATSPSPSCAPPVTFFNTDDVAGSLHHIDERVSGGHQGPFLHEHIDALTGETEVAAEQTDLEAALAACGAITITSPGDASSIVAVTTITPPPPVGRYWRLLRPFTYRP